VRGQDRRLRRRGRAGTGARISEAGLHRTSFVGPRWSGVSPTSWYVTRAAGRLASSFRASRRNRGRVGVQGGLPHLGDAEPEAHRLAKGTRLVLFERAFFEAMALCSASARIGRAGLGAASDPAFGGEVERECMVQRKRVLAGGARECRRAYTGSCSGGAELLRVYDLGASDVHRSRPCVPLSESRYDPHLGAKSSELSPRSGADVSSRHTRMCAGRR
jgi:hypothetical protein